MKEKILVGLSILFVIELVFFVVFKSIGIFNYAFFWSLVYFLLFIANTFGLYGNTYVNIVHTGLANKNKYNEYEYKDDFNRPPKKIVNLSGLIKPSNYVYLIMFVFNLLIYILGEIIT